MQGTCHTQYGEKSRQFNESQREAFGLCTTSAHCLYILVQDLIS
jgi:hypothetical protein